MREAFSGKLRTVPYALCVGSGLRYDLVTHGLQKEHTPRVFQGSLLLGLSRNASPH